MPKPPSNVIENEINPEWRNRMRKHRFETSRLLVHRQMKKGSWAIPGNAVLKDEKKEKVYTSFKHKNEHLLDPLMKQRLTVEKLMANPSQQIKLRTQHHAEKEKTIYTPHVFRNEGGNLMSSIAGAGANKFHEFRQIRRNDLDREKHFAWLRQKEAEENAYNEQQLLNKEIAERKLNKKRAKRQKKKQAEKRRREDAKERKRIKKEKLANGETVDSESTDSESDDGETKKDVKKDIKKDEKNEEKKEDQTAEKKDIAEEKTTENMEKKKIALKPFTKRNSYSKTFTQIAEDNWYNTG